MSGERKIFELDEQGKSPECQAYLEGLEQGANPFVCPYLRVLPADMTVKKYQDKGPPKRYEKGDLMCTERAKHDVSRRCGGLSNPRLNFAGYLEMTCKWPLNGSIFVKTEMTSLSYLLQRLFQLGR